MSYENKEENQLEDYYEIQQQILKTYFIGNLS